MQFRCHGVDCFSEDYVNIAVASGILTAFVFYFCSNLDWIHDCVFSLAVKAPEEPEEYLDQALIRSIL